MRKILYFLFATCFAFTVSCSNQEDDATPNGLKDGFQAVDFTVGLEKSLKSALTDKGGVVNVDATKYKVRYIAEAWTQDATPVRIARQVITKGLTAADAPKSTSFTLQLPSGITCDVLFWADFTAIATPPDDDKHYKTNDAKGLNNITIIDLNYAMNDDSRDAYFSVVKDFVVTTYSKNTNVVLKRPFAKFRFITKDWDLCNPSVTTASTVKVAFSNPNPSATSKMMNQFNVLTGLASLTETTIPNSARTGTEMLPATIGTTDCALFWDYVFVNPLDASNTVDLAPSIRFDGMFNGATQVVPARSSMSNVTLVRNKLTTVYVNYLTTGNSFGLTIDDEFDLLGNPILPNPVPTNKEAAIGATSYTTLADALTAAVTGDVVVLAPNKTFADVTVSKDITLLGQNGTVLNKLTVSSKSTIENITINALASGQISVTAPNVTMSNVILTYTGSLTRAEGIQLDGLAENFVIKNSKLEKFWKGILIANCKGVVIENCHFVKMVPFSVGETQFPFTVKNNIFERHGITQDTQVPHLIVTNAIASTQAVTGWNTDLKSLVKQIKTENTWIETLTTGKPIRIENGDANWNEYLRNVDVSAW